MDTMTTKFFNKKININTGNVSILRNITCVVSMAKAMFTWVCGIVLMQQFVYSTICCTTYNILL